MITNITAITYSKFPIILMFKLIDLILLLKQAGKKKVLVFFQADKKKQCYKLQIFRQKVFKYTKEVL